MKYLQIYESYSIKKDIEDILLEISDKGYEVKVFSYPHVIDINIYNKSHPEEFTQDNLEEITETIGRLYDYMRIHKEYGTSYVYLTSYDLPPYNTSGKRRLVGWASIDGRYSDFAWVNLSDKFNKIEIKYKEQKWKDI